jgi:hypothetical protein
MTAASREFSTGRMMIRSIAMPPRKEATSVIRNAAQNGNPAVTRLQAM